MCVSSSCSCLPVLGVTNFSCLSVAGRATCSETGVQLPGGGSEGLVRTPQLCLHAHGGKLPKCAVGRGADAPAVWGAAVSQDECFQGPISSRRFSYVREGSLYFSALNSGAQAFLNKQKASRVVSRTPRPPPYMPVPQPFVLSVCAVGA